MRILQDIIIKWSMLILVLFSACTDERFLPPTPDPNQPDEGDEQEVVIRITFPGTEQAKTKSPDTYAILESEENAVNSLDIFAFVSGGENADPSEDIYMYRVTVPASKISSSSPNGNEKKVKASLKRLRRQQRFIFIANLPDNVPLALSEGITTQGDIEKQLKFKGASWHTPQHSGNGNFTPIPMWGMIKDSMMINSASPQSLGTVNLIRALARIDVGVASGLNFFKLRNIYLCNISDSGYIAPNRTELDANVITKTNSLTERVDVTTPFPFPNQGNLLEKTIYVPESDSLIVNGNDSIKPAYLILHAEYNGADNYYRIDFSKNGKYHPLLRNHAYPIKIIGAKAGYPSFEEAKKAPMSNLNFSLTLDDENSNINEIIYIEDQYMLGISVSEILFDWDKSWIGNPVTGGTEYFPLNVYTSYENGWTATLTGGGTWATLQEATNGIKDTQGVVKIKMTEDNRTGEERKATLTIKAGLLAKEITVRQSGGANSRMIRFGSSNTATTSIPLAFANKARGGSLFGGLSFDKIAAKVIWQETGKGQTSFRAAIENAGASLTEEANIKVTATAGTSKYGNAVIAVVRKGKGVSMVGGKDDDEVLWSWHVWSMPGDEDIDMDFHNPNKPEFMNRALGKYADNKGMFYQGGRKDPFTQYPGDIIPDVMKFKKVEETNNLLNAIKNPATFYMEGDNYKHWIGTIDNISGLWSSTKTYYDPCPVGWKVPSKEESKQPWMPGSFSDDFLNGLLGEKDGTWKSQANGYQGFLWTTTPSNTNDSFGIWVVPNSGGGYVDAFSGFTVGHNVRCIKDIKLIKTAF